MMWDPQAAAPRGCRDACSMRSGAGAGPRGPAQGGQSRRSFESLQVGAARGPAGPRSAVPTAIRTWPRIGCPRVGVDAGRVVAVTLNGGVVALVSGRTMRGEGADQVSQGVRSSRSTPNAVARRLSASTVPVLRPDPIWETQDFPTPAAPARPAAGAPRPRAAPPPRREPVRPRRWQGRCRAGLPVPEKQIGKTLHSNGCRHPRARGCGPGVRLSCRSRLRRPW
jgi:hypothetical protein